MKVDFERRRRGELFDRIIQKGNYSERKVAELFKIIVDVAVSRNTPESMNPSVVDEEEGLPSPPLDDLAFLNPHSMSLELSEKFFDGRDDYGNTEKRMRTVITESRQLRSKT
ncbi:putative non-specific serine/threonine protein kinase [Helianthus annuus]|nr:putative non-specific serine/threonine protein kinase [Helianthus annuus]